MGLLYVLRLVVLYPSRWEEDVRWLCFFWSCKLLGASGNQQFLDCAILPAVFAQVEVLPINSTLFFSFEITISIERPDKQCFDNNYMFPFFLCPGLSEWGVTHFLPQPK